MELPPLLQIEDFLISTDIITECFVCDYSACRGVCCIAGESGAPLNAMRGKAAFPDLDEAALLEKNYPAYSHLMTESARESVGKQGFCVIDVAGDQTTPLSRAGEIACDILAGNGLADKSESDFPCAFCHFENGSCLCAIEKAGIDKPISCSLYPVRVRHLSSGMTALNLHRWDICKCAFDLGRSKGVRVYEFLQGPLVRAFGREFYCALDAARKAFAP